jgi:hypothetical protein
MCICSRRELCDGLQSNIHLVQLDLRLTGNPLETFIRDHAVRFASIPCLTTLDITACGKHTISLLTNTCKTKQQYLSIKISTMNCRHY